MASQNSSILISHIYNSRKVALELMKKQGYNVNDYANFSINEVKVGFEKRHEALHNQMMEVREKLNIILEFIKKNDK